METNNNQQIIEQMKTEQGQIRDAYNEHHSPLTPYEEANKLRPQYHWQNSESINGQCSMVNLQCEAILSLIDWRMFLLFWGFKGETLTQLLTNPEAEKTLHEGKRFLESCMEKDLLKVDILYKVEPARRQGNDIVFTEDGQHLPMLRSQSAAQHYRCLADYFDEEQPSPVGLFVVTARPTLESADETERLMMHALCARLAEAAAEWLSSSMDNGQWSMRVGFGYATCPDHSLKRIVFDRLQAEQKMNVSLTDHYSIVPSTSVCGLLISHPEATYFPVGRIDQEQLKDYCQRRGITTEEGESLLSKYVNHSS